MNALIKKSEMITIRLCLKWVTASHHRLKESV